MFLNRTVFGKTFNRFCDIFVTFHIKGMKSFQNSVQIDFIFCLFPLRLIY